MENVKPSQLVVLISGALLFFFSFLDVFKDGDNAWGDFGVTTWPALIGLIVAGGLAAVAFGNVQLPERILTFSVDQLMIVLAFTAVLIELALLLLSLISDLTDPAAGIWLSFLAAAGLLAGTVMVHLEGPSARTATTPPSAF